MDHLALSSPMTKTALFQPTIVKKNHQRFHASPTTVSCRATASLRSRKETGRADFYRLLSISSPKNVGCEEIKRAYRSMALRYHPDVCHDESMKEELTKMFVQLNEAYRTLSDPVLKNEYDFELGLNNLRCDDSQTSSCTENDRSDLERQFERTGWQEHHGSDSRNVHDDASELRRKNTCRMVKKGHNRMRR